MRASVIEKKVKRKRLGLLFILFTMFVSIFLILLTQTDFFHVYDIEVSGESYLNKNQIILASGMQLGENLFKIDTKRMETNLRVHPYIKDVKIKRRFPNGLKISIKEREEFLLMDYLGSFIYLDHEGRVLNVLAHDNDKALPIIVGSKIKTVKIGETLGLEGDLSLQQIIDFMRLCKTFGLEKDILKIDVGDISNIEIHMNNGTNVAFGDINNVKYKLSFLLSIFDQLKSKNKHAKTIYLNKGKDGVIITDNN